MKLQHMSVVFVIIFLPIILVTSYYISLQVNTIKLQTSYDTKLLDATYDAMSAFELNTANEDLSSVADSLRSIIEASNNIFFNTLATNMGVSNASKSYVQPYVPAILYTLYDGYYIYSPTNTPIVCTDTKGQTISTDSKGVTFSSTINYNGKAIGVYNFNQSALKYNDDGSATAEYNTENGFNQSNASVAYSTLENNGIQGEYGQLLYENNDGTYSTVIHSISGNYNRSTKYKQSYILKSFISYSATYVNSNVNVTVNYTLDNFLTIEGTINNIYYAKSGYLISDSLISEIDVDSEKITSWTKYSQETLDSYINDPASHEVKIILNDGTQISNRDGSYTLNGTTNYWDDSQNAVQYYVDSWIFSKWVRENLSDIKASDIINNDYEIFNLNSTSQSTSNINENTKLEDTMFHVFSNDTNIYPFRENSGYSNDPENSESSFALHRRNVIKNSITYNITLSMISYTEWTKTTEFNMPILQDTEWDKILNNVSIVTFMQGLQCGLKIYSNYAIVSSTNNEISVTPNEIYYVPRILENYGNNSNNLILTTIDDDDVYEIAHRIDCPELKISYDASDSADIQSKNLLGDNINYISFTSKEIKYDKIYDKTSSKYIYDHKVYTDYSCIVDSNYILTNSSGNAITDSSGNVQEGNTNILDYLINGGTATATRLKAYRIAVAKERNNLYKSIAFLENTGYQELTGSYTVSNGTVISLSSFDSSYKNTLDISHIAGIDIVIENTNSVPGVYTLPFNINLNSNSSYSYTAQILPTNSTQTRTVSFEGNITSDSSLNNIKISFGTTTTIKSIKIYYK
jgi:hypothetical protein